MTLACPTTNSADGLPPGLMADLLLKYRSAGKQEVGERDHNSSGLYKPYWPVFGKNLDCRLLMLACRDYDASNQSQVEAVCSALLADIDLLK